MVVAGSAVFNSADRCDMIDKLRGWKNWELW
jgi:hypothetical protein